MSMLTETLGRAGLTIREALAGEDDLSPLERELGRELAIRQVMTETGEDREIVEEMVGAVESMGEEAVLDLCEGEPTTLADALSRYVSGLEARWPDGADLDQETVVGDLGALLTYPWPQS